MEFKLINETAPKFADTVMSTERQDELSKKLDEMTDKWGKNEALRVSNIMIEIASFCNTIEEMTYCVIMHFTWWAKRGVLVD